MDAKIAGLDSQWEMIDNNNNEVAQRKSERELIGWPTMQTKPYKDLAQPWKYKQILGQMVIP